MRSHTTHIQHVGTLLLVCATLVAMFAWPQSLLAEEPNLIENGGFEQSRRGWFTGVAQAGTRSTVDREVAYEGAGSFHMSSTSIATTSIIQDIELPGPGTYRLGGVLRVDSLETTVDNQSGAAVSLAFRDAKGQGVGNAITFVWSRSEEGVWQPIEEYLTVPVGVSSVRLSVMLNQAQGTVWWDDLQLARVFEGLTVVDARASVLPSGTVRLTWSMPVGFQEDQVTYLIFRSEEPEVNMETEPLATLNEPQYVDRSTLPETTYYYRIVPVSMDGARGASTALAVKVRSITQPTEITAHLDADWNEAAGIAQVTWTLGDDIRAKRLVLERSAGSSDADPWEPVAELPPHVASHKDALPKSVASPDLRYRLTVVNPEGDVAVQMQTNLGAVVPRLTEYLEAGVHPRLFISAEEIEAINAAAAANPVYRILLNNEIILPAVRVPAKYATGITLPPKGVNGPHWELAEDARVAALGYAFTGNEAYAKVAREILLAYARQYKQNPLAAAADGRMTKQTRDEAVWIVELAWAYDLTWNSPLWTEEDRRLLKEDLFLDAAAIIHPRGSNAWRITLNAGVAAVAFLFNDAYWIDKVIYGEEGFVKMMGEWAREDGLSWLQSISHHNANRERLAIFAEAAYRSGYDLYNVVVRGKSLKQMFDITFYHAFSNGKHPVVGHARPWEELTFDWAFGAAYVRYRDPRYAALWRQLRTFSPLEFTVPSIFYLPALVADEETVDLAVSFGHFAEQGYNVAGSTLFADSGMAVLRGSGVEADGPEVAFLYKPHGVVVGHQTPDALSIMVAGDKDHWLPGPGQYHYSQAPPEHGGWYVQTVARNGVVVDETSQHPQGVSNDIYPLDRDGRSVGRLLGFVALPSLSAVRGEANAVYEGVEMQRTVLLRAPYFFDRYVVNSEAQHQYDWVMHINGAEKDISLTETTQPGKLGTRVGYQYIDTLRSSETNETWRASWEREGGRLQLIMGGGMPTTVYRAEGFGPELTRMPMLVARRNEATTEFLAVVELFDETPVVRDVTAFHGANVAGAIIERSDTAEPDIVAWRTGMVAAELDVLAGMTFRGEMAFFGAHDPKGVRNMLVLGGTSVAAPGISVSVDDPADLAIEWATPELIAVSQNSDGRRTITVTLKEGDAQYRLFQLGIADETLLIGPVTATEVTLSQGIGESGARLSWQAASGVVYVLAKDAPDEAWLQRYVVEMNVGKN